MDKIYSRKRIKLPKAKLFLVGDNGRTKKIIRLCIIFFVAFITFSYILKSVEPIFEEICIAKAKEVATNITNIQSSNVLKEIDYSDIVKVIENENGKTSIVHNDVVKMNRIASDIAIAIQKELSKIQDNKIEIPIGTFTANKYFAGSGPNIKIKIVPVGDIITDFKTEFVSSGINQTSHRIYLELKCTVNILTPFNIISEEIVNQVLLAESVIIGEVPSSYYNLEGLNSQNAIDMIN